MNKDDYLLLDNQLCFAIYAASKEIIRLYRPLLDRLEITYTQYLVLMVLWETTPLSFKHLGERLYLDSGTLSPVLKKMEEKGLLIRSRLENDERQLMIELTEKAHQLKEAAYMVPEQMICRLQIDIEEANLLRTKIKNLLTRLPRD